MVMKVRLEKEKMKACLTCPICDDFFNRATTISECLHTFCRKCIHDKIIEDDLDTCPVCDADLGCAPLEKLRPDHSLQDLRLKLFPAVGENCKAEAKASAAPQSNSREMEKSLSSPVANAPTSSSPSSNADATEESSPGHGKDLVCLVSDSLIVEKPGEKVGDDVPQIKISSRELPKSRAGRRKSRPSPKKNYVQLESDMLIEEEPPSKAEKAPDIAQDVRLSYEAVRSVADVEKEKTMKENDGFSLNLWKHLSSMAEAAEKTKFSKSNYSENTAVSEPQDAHQDDASIEKTKELDTKSIRNDARDQMIVESVVPSNTQEDEKSVPGSVSDKAIASVDKQKGGGNCSSPPLLRPRKRRKLLNFRQRNEYSPEVVGTSQEATTVEANSKAEGRNIPVWFSLIASANQRTKVPLPQISSRYLRVKDANLPVSYIQKYLVKKLSLASEAEVEISLRGEPLLSSQRLYSLLDWWVKTAPVSEQISPSIGGSAKDFVMVLSYSRRSLL